MASLTWLPSPSTSTLFAFLTFLFCLPHLLFLPSSLASLPILSCLPPLPLLPSSPSLPTPICLSLPPVLSSRPLSVPLLNPFPPCSPIYTLFVCCCVSPFISPSASPLTRHSLVAPAERRDWLYLLWASCSGTGSRRQKPPRWTQSPCSSAACVSARKGCEKLTKFASGIWGPRSFLFNKGHMTPALGQRSGDARV